MNMLCCASDGLVVSCCSSAPEFCLFNYVLVCSIAALGAASAAGRRAGAACWTSNDAMGTAWVPDLWWLVDGGGGNRCGALRAHSRKDDCRRIVSLLT